MILAGFTDKRQLDDAVQRLAAEGVAGVETLTPAPPDETTYQLLPLVMLVAGVLGAIGGFALQSYATVISFPEDIGGRPLLFWPAYIPFAFETGALAAVVAGFLGYLVVNRLPRLYDPIDEADITRQASRDTWFVAIRSDDPRMLDRARRVLGGLRPALREEIGA